MKPIEKGPVFWCGRPSEDDEHATHKYLAVRFTSNRVYVDSDQFLATVELLERDGDDVEPREGLLKQYGGESLRSDILGGMIEHGLDDLEGTEWLIEYDEALGFTAQHVD